MRNFFRRKSSGEASHSAEVRRRFSMPLHEEIEVLHRMNRPDMVAQRSLEILPTLSTVHENGVSDVASVALSETETLAYSRRQRMDLQDTFDENFTGYLPFVLRQLRRQHEQSMGEGEEEADARITTSDLIMKDDSDFDDDKTIASGLDDYQRHIMRRKTSKYNYKRLLVVASEFIRSNTYVFPDLESFRVFRYLRSNNKRLRKNSMIVYEPNGNIKRIPRRASVSEHEGLPDVDDGVVDMRQHIIPLEYKLKGSGLPLFKILVPYMSSFRKKVPYMVFRRYREIPAPPSLFLKQENEDDEKFESYEFCTIHMKTFQQYKRYVLQFTPENAPPFKVFVFQNNYRPFTDFKYKDTRFRVIGSSLVTAYLMNYNPDLKLIVIDEDQPALCDNLVNKKSGLDRRGSRSGARDDTLPPEEMANPVPEESNRILKEDEGGFLHAVKRNFIPNNMPPFGRFLDSCVYPIELLLFPKKYSEVGKIELYQALENNAHPDMSSTLSVDLDQLVLTTVLLTLRETSLRTTNRYSNGSLVSRIGSLGAAPGFGPTAGMGFPYTASM